MPEKNKIILEMRGVTKKFPHVVANDNIDIKVHSGEVHGLLGENGAGKTTLMNILYGLYKPDMGEIFIEGRKVEIRNSSDAIGLGIGMVHQHFMLISNLTALENVVLGMPMKHPPFLELNNSRGRFLDLAKQYSFDVDPDVPVWQLPVGNQQWLEILKQLFRKAKVLILDEPTAVLAPSQVEELFKIIKRLAEEGYAIIFISHKLDEVKRVTDYITVLRDGRVVGTVKTSEAEPAQMANMMVGRPITMKRMERSTPANKKIVLNINKIDCKNDRGILALKEFSLKVRAGEIVGIAGVDGNGQRELAEAVAGLRTINKGEISINEFPVKNVVNDTNILGYIPEDRRRTGLVVNKNVAENLVMKTIRQYVKNGIIEWKKIFESSENLIDEYNIKVPDCKVQVRKLSGGNQQRVVIARELNAKPVLILASQPTRGLDISSVETVHSFLLRERNRGAAVLFISAELNEVLAISDRIVVLHKGQIMGDLDANTANIEEIGKLMLGIQDKKNRLEKGRENGQ